MAHGIFFIKSIEPSTMQRKWNRYFLVYLCSHQIFTYLIWALKYTQPDTYTPLLSIFSYRETKRAHRKPIIILNKNKRQHSHSLFLLSFAGARHSQTLSFTCSVQANIQLIKRIRGHLPYAHTSLIQFFDCTFRCVCCTHAREKRTQLLLITKPTFTGHLVATVQM